MKELLLFLTDKLITAFPALIPVFVFSFFFDRARTKKRWGWLVLYVLYLNAMLTLVGIPSISYLRPNAEVNWIPFTDFSRGNLLGMALNVVLFMPLGAFLPIYFEGFRSPAKTAAAGFGLSLVVELSQLLTFRLTDVDDLITNTLGTLLGFLLAKLFISRQKEILPEQKNAASFICVTAIVYLTQFLLREPMSGLVYSLPIFR